jgi:hypothetical protein
LLFTMDGESVGHPLTVWSKQQQVQLSRIKYSRWLWSPVFTIGRIGTKPMFSVQNCLVYSNSRCDSILGLVGGELWVQRWFISMGSLPGKTNTFFRDADVFNLASNGRNNKPPKHLRCISNNNKQRKRCIYSLTRCLPPSAVLRDAGATGQR